MNNYSPNSDLAIPGYQFDNLYGSKNFYNLSPPRLGHQLYTSENYNLGYSNPKLFNNYNSNLNYYSPPRYSINLNDQRYPYIPFQDSPNRPFVPKDVPTYATIPHDTVYKIKKDGNVEFRDEQKNVLEMHEEKILVTSPPEKKLVEEVVEHEIEVTEPPYVDYEEKEVSKLIEVPQPPLLKTIEEVIQKEIYVPQPPQFKTIKEKIRVPIQKFPPTQYKKVQETVMKEVTLQPPPKEITVHRTLEEKITPISAETKGNTTATMYQDDYINSVKWVPRTRYNTNYYLVFLLEFTLPTCPYK